MHMLTSSTIQPAERILENAKLAKERRKQLRSRPLRAIAAVNAAHIEQSVQRGFARGGDECELQIWKRPMIERNFISEARQQLYDIDVEPYSVHIPNFYINGRGKGEFGDETKRLIDSLWLIYEFFEPKAVVMHPLESGLGDLVKNLNEVASNLPPGMIFTLENIKERRSNLRNSGSVKEIRDAFGAAVPAGLGFCLDTTHVVSPGAGYATETVLGLIAAMGRDLGHMHISDLRITSKAKEEHIPIGSGVLEWAAIKRKLVDIASTGHLVVEYT